MSNTTTLQGYNNPQIATSGETMTSLQIAEVTGKNHKDVMRAIRNMEPSWQKVRGRNFALTFRITELPNGATRQDPCYVLSKTECLYIATKFNDEARAKLVLRWEELELANQPQQPKVPTSFREALLLAAEQQGVIEEQQRQLALQQVSIRFKDEQIRVLDEAVDELQEQTKYLDEILRSKSTVAITQIAQDYGMSAVKFNRLLADLNIQYRCGNQWILYQPYKSEGYVHSETFTTDNFRVVMTSKWTQKGRAFLYRALKSKGILPLIEQNTAPVGCKPLC